MSDDLRTRIVSALQLASDRQIGWRGILDCVDLADAVIREVLTPEFLADMIVQAVQKAADDETD